MLGKEAGAFDVVGWEFLTRARHVDAAVALEVSSRDLLDRIMQATSTPEGSFCSLQS